MAPEIALSRLSEMRDGQLVLDPMCGSGMVLNVASRQGLRSIGVDSDPLAQTISSATSVSVDDSVVRRETQRLIEQAMKDTKTQCTLDWIDSDQETTSFIDFWFDTKQKMQLRALSYNLVVRQIVQNEKINNLLKIGISRLIITKNPKASLARDTAHSRPHRVVDTNDFDVFRALPKSMDHVLSALSPKEVRCDSKTYLGDAKSMQMIQDSSVDCIVTSPPYLNAIDYMRGHKFSLVWFGYRISDLRRIRASAVGAERKASIDKDSEFAALEKEHDLSDLTPREVSILFRYFNDLRSLLRESKRVLKGGGSATYVIGNSVLQGKSIKNNTFLKKAAKTVGFEIESEITRKIPENRRYLPIAVAKDNALSKRLREEHIIVLKKL